MTKTKVGILYGGRSGEHEVSLVSALSVMRHIDTQEFDVIPIAIDKQGQWWLNQFQDLMAITEHAAFIRNSNSVALEPSITPSTHSLVGLCDVVFPVMHGPLYEDGALQGIFIHAGIPFVGCSVLSSAVAMDKHMAKSIVENHDILVVPNQLVSKPSWYADRSSCLTTIESAIAYPLFVKPNSLGSSVGNTLVHNQEELIAAIDTAFYYDNYVLVEQFLKIREIELSVLRNQDPGGLPLVSVPGEIAIGDSDYEFYSYEAKYNEQSNVALHIPAALSERQVETAQMLAQRVFTLLRCEGMARVDLFLDQGSGKFYFNEINTIPGFTQISMYPKLWEASGLPYAELITKLIHLAFDYHEQDRQIQREWQ